MVFPPLTQINIDYYSLAARRGIIQRIEHIVQVATVSKRFISRTMNSLTSLPLYQDERRRRSSLPSLGGTVLDGSLNRVPSTSGASVRHFKGDSPRGMNGLDPPRPPKEGYEWVWYPEGYWAERKFPPIDFTATTSRTPEAKVWKWRRRSRKTGSGSHDNDALRASPKANQPQQQPPTSNNTPNSPQSPFRTEEAHILALQSPGVQLSTSTNLVESEWLAPKHGLQTPRSLDLLPPAEVSLDRPSEPRETFGFLFKRGISAMSVLQKTKGKAKKYSVSGPASERRSDPVVYSSNGSSIMQTGANGNEQEMKQTLEQEESRRASRPSYIRFPRRAWSEKRSFHPKSGETAMMTESVTPPSSNSSILGPRTTFSVILPLKTTSQYPGGEATRIHTPPLKEDTADGRPRGYFFNVSIPIGANNTESSVSSKESNFTSTTMPMSLPPTPLRHPQERTEEEQGGHRDSRRCDFSPPPTPGISGLLLTPGASSLPTTPGTADKKRREWWDAPTKSAEARRTERTARLANGRSRGDGEGGRLRKKGQFTFDVPEHLPNSPMCPANPKHKSKGKGVCVYHGRRKSASMGDDAYDSRDTTSGSVSPDTKNSPELAARC